MKRVVLAMLMLSICRPAHAQFGGLLNKIDTAKQKADDAKQKADQLNVSEDEEIRIGKDVSTKIRERFGVVQDEKVTKYVALVGTLLARQSERPKLPWTFIVLDTDGVNAFAAPGGIVHITRGALGLIQNEAELADVLGHEITHVAHKHAVAAIRKNNAVQMGANETLSDRGPFLDRIATKAYEMILENAFDRGDELDADKGSVELAAKLGYAPAALADFLTRLDERNKDQPARNGLFASHPETKERIEKVRALAGKRTGATVLTRYTSNVSYKPTPVTQVATVVDGASGLTGSTKGGDAKDPDSKDKDKDAKQPEQKKKGFGLSNLTGAVKPEKESTQVSASGGARGVGPDRAAKGGPNPNPVVVKVTDAELTAFKAGIV
ncbi:MAG TPA: M48 family metalloprotease [Vicinamibacterales bacterium]|nr:M48 family metalloprotease [Vicinamibacterales bacterium]